MGRTLETSRQLLRGLQAEWSAFARLCPRQDQEAVAWLWQAAERHASAVGNLARPAPMEAILFAMLLEVLKETRRLEARVATLEPSRSAPTRADLPPAPPALDETRDDATTRTPRWEGEDAPPSSIASSRHRGIRSPEPERDEMAAPLSATASRPRQIPLDSPASARPATPERR